MSSTYPFSLTEEPPEPQKSELRWLRDDKQKDTATVKGMYHLFLGNFTYTFLLAVTAIAVGRILGPSGYGIYTVALIIPSFLFTAIRLGLDSAATRYAARLRSEGKEDEAISFVYAMTIFGVLIAAVSSLVFVGLSGWIANSVVDRPELGAVVIPIAMISVLGQTAFYITDLGMTGLGKFGKAGLMQVLQGISKLVITVGLALGFGVVGAVEGYTAGFLVSGVVATAYIIRLARRRFPKLMKAKIAVGVRYGFPIYLSTLASGFVAPVISTVLALTVSNLEIGGYSAAATFTTLIALLTYPISKGLFPLFSINVDDPMALRRTYATAVRFTALVVTPMATFIIAFSGPLIVTVYGNSYDFGGEYLALFASTSLLAGIGSQAWEELLNGIGRTKDVLVTTALGSAVSVGSGIALIEIVGVAGAIAGQIVGTAVSLAVGTLMVRRRLETKLRVAGVWKFYAASAVAALLSWPLSWLVPISDLALAAGALTFLVLFVPLLALLRALNETDFEALRQYFEFSVVISKPLEVAISYYDLAQLTFHRMRESLRRTAA